MEAYGKQDKALGDGLVLHHHDDAVAKKLPRRDGAEHYGRY